MPEHRPRAGLITSTPCPSMWKKSKPLQKCCVECAVLYTWGDCKEGDWRWEPQHQGTWRPGDSSKSWQPEGPSSFECTMLGFAVEGPNVIWGLWSTWRDQALWAQGASFPGRSFPSPSVELFSSIWFRLYG